MDDPVVDFRHVTLLHDQNEEKEEHGEPTEKQFTCTIRTSGQIDLYWNCKLVYSSDKDMNIQKFEVIKGKRTEVNEHIKYQKCCVNFDNFLIQKTVKRYVGNSNVPEIKPYALMISLKQEQRISLADANEIEQLIDPKWMGFFCSQVIKDHYKPFETFVLYMNYFLIAHKNIVSYYDTE